MSQVRAMPRHRAERLCGMRGLTSLAICMQLGGLMVGIAGCNRAKKPHQEHEFGLRGEFLKRNAK